MRKWSADVSGPRSTASAALRPLSEAPWRFFTQTQSGRIAGLARRKPVLDQVADRLLVAAQECMKVHKSTV
jgi:hypothetical protein